MPASTGLSSCSAERPILPRPSARSVPRCCSLWPIWLRICVTRTFATLWLLRLRRLRLFVFGGRLVRQDLGDGLATDLRDVLRASEIPQAVNRRLRHVDRIRRAEALRENVADPGELEHRPDAAAGDHTCPLAGRTEEHARCVGAPEDLVRDRRTVLRNGEQVLLRVLDRLGDCERNLARLPVADADAVHL